MLVTRILGRAASLGIDVTQHTQHQLECWLKRKGVDVSTGFVEVNKQSLYRDFVQHVAKNKPPGDTVNVLRLLLALLLLVFLFLFPVFLLLLLLLILLLALLLLHVMFL